MSQPLVYIHILPRVTTVRVGGGKEKQHGAREQPTRRQVREGAGLENAMRRDLVSLNR